MAINSDTHNVISNIFKDAEKQIDDFHFHVILPNASQCHKERYDLISKNNGLKDIFKSILWKMSKFHEASIDKSIQKQALNSDFNLTDEEIKIFSMTSHDYMHQMRINHEKLKAFNADQQIIDSYLKKIEKVQQEVINVETIF